MTNYSVNKKADTYVKNTGDTTTEKAADAMEFKWSLKQLKDEWEKMGINYNEIFTKIKDICLKTLMSVEGVIVSSVRSNKFRGQCYEIYGFDVLVDNNLRPWLLEVNVLPSLSSSSPFDKHVKSMLLSDTLHLIGFNIFDRRKVQEEMKNGKIGIRQYIKNGTQREEQGTENKSKSPYGELISPLLIKKSPTKKLELGSPEKMKIKNQYAIPSFLDGFDYLTEDDLDILATYEEEQARRQ